MTDARSALARRVRRQAGDCERLGSPLYGGLLERVAADLEAGGPSWEILGGREHPAGSVPSLRLMGAVHRLALEGRAPALARCYDASRQPRAEVAAADVWPVLRGTLEDHRDELRRRVEDPVQTNEVGRSGALLGGFLVAARDTGLPLRALELGASAGLNLRFDHFAYEVDAEVLGEPQSPVRLTPDFEGGRPPLDVPLEVAERRGCDPRPLDPATDEGRLTLLSYVWPDQAERLERLEAAIAVARRVPAEVESQGAARWLERRLGDGPAGCATVVFHSILVQYLEPGERAAVDRAIEQAAAAADARRPLARLAMEPAGALADVRLTQWPGGEERLLARAGYHGQPVRWMMEE